MDKMGIFDLLMLPFNIAIAALLLPVVLIGGIVLAVALCVYTVLAALGLFVGALEGVVKILEWIDRLCGKTSDKSDVDNAEPEKPTINITVGLKGETVQSEYQDEYPGKYFTLAQDAAYDDEYSWFAAYAINQRGEKCRVYWATILPLGTPEDTIINYDRKKICDWRKPVLTVSDCPEKFDEYFANKKD